MTNDVDCDDTAHHSQPLAIEIPRAIEPASTPWASPIVIATRPGTGKLRFCLDLRAVNRLTTADRYPLPRIEQILQAAQGCTWFSTLDLAEGFLQLPLDDESKQVTGFRGPRFGHYQFRSSIFGLRNVPAAFQRMLDTILADVLWLFVVVYVDDVLIFSKSFDDHCAHLAFVRSLLDGAGIRCRASKCSLFQREAHYVGLVFDGSTVRLDDAAFRSIADCPIPKSKEGLRKFVGLINRFGTYIPAPRSDERLVTRGP